ncbi:MAG: hypothetical protein EAZ08_03480 [Cytophagales bacterium]|nr:MAG: hypothetical protein EAZ08_03480 [Cytophagales bacterium]
MEIIFCAETVYAFSFLFFIALFRKGMAKVLEIISENLSIMIRRQAKEKGSPLSLLTYYPYNLIVFAWQ